MAKGDIHTAWNPITQQWSNKVEGNDRASNTGTTKDPVKAKGREMAMERGVEHFIHRKEGNTIEERNTYPRSRDPRSSKG